LLPHNRPPHHIAQTTKPPQTTNIGGDCGVGVTQEGDIGRRERSMGSSFGDVALYSPYTCPDYFLNVQKQVKEQALTCFPYQPFNELKG
jgi:hypothetical protein